VYTNKSITIEHKGGSLPHAPKPSIFPLHPSTEQAPVMPSRIELEMSTNDKEIESES